MAKIITPLAPRYTSTGLEAGCDEAGRGCLAGGVYAAAVILPSDFHDPKLTDSKQVSERERRRLRLLIEREAISWAVGVVDVARIDEVNILNGAFEAMNIAIDNLSIQPDSLLIDGQLFRTSSTIPYNCMIGGDARFMNIAAASILAKTHRDEEMERLHELFPAYGWSKNKGYGTAAHRKAIAEHGVTPHHRLSFRLI